MTVINNCLYNPTNYVKCCSLLSVLHVYIKHFCSKIISSCCDVNFNQTIHNVTTYTSGDCTAGFFCQGGANTSAPSPSASYPNNDVCPPGNYCPAGTKYWVPCPIGTYKATTCKLTWYWLADLLLSSIAIIMFPSTGFHFSV